MTKFPIIWVWLPLLGLLLIPSAALAVVQTGGGYTVNGQFNIVNSAVSGGGYGSQSGGSPISGQTTGGGYTNNGGAYRGNDQTINPNNNNGGGGGGGGGGSRTCPSGTTGVYPNCINNTPGAGDTFASILAVTAPGTAPYRADPFPDGKIDVLDFNTLMVNWGKVSGDTTTKFCADKILADINCDSKVDILDFNLLMVYWGKNITRKL